MLRALESDRVDGAAPPSRWRLYVGLAVLVVAALLLLAAVLFAPP